MFGNPSYAHEKLLKYQTTVTNSINGIRYVTFHIRLKFEQDITIGA